MKYFGRLLFYTTLLIPFSSLAQGGWDIGYIPIDSIKPTDIGKDIKLDFRAASDTTSRVPDFLINFVGKEDTATIMLDNKEIELVEKREIHVDWGFYDEQYLECLNYSHNRVLRVYHSVIEMIKSDSLLVRLYMETYYKDNRGRISDIPNRFSKSVWIPKKELNGVMIKM
ncbi:MAG: hypothetical protein HEP71_06690 [Roseivirga sp.]|nr:hypothetical protein [Roseivirga sp.]